MAPFDFTEEVDLLYAVLRHPDSYRVPKQQWVKDLEQSGLIKILAIEPDCYIVTRPPKSATVSAAE